MGKPEVVTGARGPQDRSPRLPLDRNEELAQQARQIRSDDKDEHVFQSKAVAYRFQVTAPSDIFDPLSGKKHAARPVVAQFKDGVYRTKDNEIATALLLSKDCGVGRDFWLVDDMKAHGLKLKEDEYAARLAADPVLRERVLARLGADVQSFAPPKPAASPAAPPAA